MNIISTAVLTAVLLYIYEYSKLRVQELLLDNTLNQFSVLQLNEWGIPFRTLPASLVGRGVIYTDGH